ncbi:MAG TPA: hypothetical protein VFC46_01755 [Humisphaera sp.]|nr:hypothetical protein [Humisphaera sp.]
MDDERSLNGVARKPGESPRPLAKQHLARRLDLGVGLSPGHVAA